MRKTFQIVLFALSVIACQKQNRVLASVDKNATDIEKYYISANISMSKTILDKNTLNVLWQTSDMIGLVDDEGKITPATLESGEGSTSAVFSYKASSPINVVYAYYPYTGAESIAGTKLNISLPSSQDASSGSTIVGGGLIPMAGRISDGSLSFSNCCSVAKIMIKGTENYVRRVKISSSSSRLNGPGYIDLASDSPVFISSVAEDADEYYMSELVINPSGKEGRRLHPTPDNAVAAYFVLPKGSYENFTIETLGNSSDISTSSSTDISLFKTANTSFEFNEGKIRTVNATLSAPATIYGRVMCGHLPVKDVMVTDGYLTTLTDKTGAYSLESVKKNALVYITIPSGYTVAKNYGSVPDFFCHTSRAALTPERKDFTLLDDGDQTNHTVLCIGDMHLVNSGNKDIEQFHGVVADINAYVADNPDKKIYAVQLGDSTWDMFWYIGAKFKIPNYLAETDAFNIAIFNTMGNHDGDMYETDDWSYAAEFRKNFGPNYYSFNIGNYHYMVLDNVYTCNDGTGSSGRDYRFKLTDYEIEWIEKDLSYVNASTPIVVMAHIPIFNANGNPSMSGEGNMTTSEYLAPFKNHNVVRYLCCHSHSMYNNTKVVDGKTIVENNCASICGDFWTSGKQVPSVRMNRDGCPSGYNVLEVSGNANTLSYKTIGRQGNYLFRTYDRNDMLITADRYIPTAGQYHKEAYNKYTGSFYYTLSNNLTYVYVWAMDDGWTITASENGVSKSPIEKVSQYDPLYMITSMVTQCNDGKPDVSGYSLNIPPIYCKNVYIFQSSSASAPLSITVTDKYGNSQTEVMKRPKAFKVSTYASISPFDQGVTVPYIEDGQFDL